MTMQNRPSTTMSAAGGGSIVDRIMGVVTLKAPVYREIADDTTATGQAAAIVVIVAIVLGVVGALLGQAVANIPGLPSAPGTAPDAAATGFSIGALIFSVLMTLLGWLIGGWLVSFVATTFFGGKTNPGEMLRVFGFTRIFSLLGVIPVIGTIIGAILGLVGTVIGIREAAEFDTGKAILTGIVAFIIYLIALFVLALIIGAILAAIGLAAGAAGAGAPP